MKRSFFSLRSTSGKFILGLFALLVIARLILPYALKRYINVVLKDHVDGYTGSIRDLDVSLYRGAYEMRDLVFSKVENKTPVPFIESKVVDFSIAWKPLFKGHVVGKVALDRFKINFVNAPTKAQSQTGTEGSGWRATIDDLFPLDIQDLKILHSEVHFRDFSTRPNIDLFLREVQADATNLTNAENANKELVSNIAFQSSIQQQGRLQFGGAFNLLKEPTSFDLNLQARDVNLVEFSNFFKTYANFDVASGRFDLFSEAAASRGKIKGYIKPLLTHMKVLAAKDKHDDVATPSDLIAGTVNLFIRRYSTDQVATRIPFEGDLSNPKIETWTAVKNLFGNAFGKQIKPKLDHSISIADPKRLAQNDTRRKHKKRP